MSITSTWPSVPQQKALHLLTTKSDFPSDEAYYKASRKSGIEEKILRAFAKVEGGPYGGFLDTGEPVILFERHHFHRYTKGRYDSYKVSGLPSSINTISSSKPGGYGAVSIQHMKLDHAAKLDRQAALMSASWGLFQILGSNFARAGYDSLQEFVNSMYRSVDDHLYAVCEFIASDVDLYNALRNKDWKKSAVLYNGPRQKGYDIKLGLAYSELS